MADNPIPTDEELKQYVADHLEYFMSAVKEGVGQVNPSYFEDLETRKKGWKRVRLIIPVLALGVVFSLLLKTMVIGFVSVTFVVAIWCVYSGFKMIRVVDGKEVRRVTIAAEDALLPLIAQASGVSAIESVQHTKKDKKDFDTAYRKPGENMFQANDRLTKIARQLHTSYEHDDIIKRLNDSTLAAEVQDRIPVAIMYPIIYKVHTDSRQIMFCQLLGRIFSNEKATKAERLFVRRMGRSLFVSVDLPRKLEGVTIITTEQKEGLATQEYYLQSLKKIGLEISELEWNDFENMLHVMTSNEVEARYILTPDYMSAVYEWWKGKRQDIRISFGNNKMSLLVSGEGVTFGQGLAEISDIQVRAYIESILIPLVHIMYLVNAFDSSR